MFPKAVSTMVGGMSPPSRRRCRKPKPSRPGMFKSVRITSAENSLSLSSASLPSAAVSGVMPHAATIAARPERWLDSSSTIKTFSRWFKETFLPEESRLPILRRPAAKVLRRGPRGIPWANPGTDSQFPANCAGNLVSVPGLRRGNDLLFDSFWTLVGRLQVFASFFLGALGVVFGADGEAVFVDGALSLPGDIEDLAQVDAAPDLGPFGVEIAGQGLAE